MKLTRLAACVLLFFVGGTASAGQPHVVFIIADDIGWNDLGCYGSPSSRTPNIDAFAETATRFDNAYLTASSCSPSRASLLLGRYPHNCGKAGELHRPMPEHLVGTAFTALLREAGYHAELVGKHHMSVERPDGSPRPLIKPAFDAVSRGRVPGNRSGAAPWAETIRDRPTDRPCVFWFASSDAHRPWDGDLDWDAAKYGPKHDPAAVVPPAPMPDTPETRQDFASYLNEVTRFDYFVGEVLATLAGEGIADDTVVIVTSDNGRPFPRAKTRLHDPGMKMPLLVRLPAEYRQPATTDALASAVDVAPTVLDLCGVAVPETVQGVSLLPLLTESRPVRRFAFSEHNWHDHAAHGRSVRDADGYLYVRNARPDGSPWIGPSDSIRSPSHGALVDLRGESPDRLSPAQRDVFASPRPAEELYFTPDDPGQVSDLIDDAGHADKRDELRGILDRWQAATADDLPDDPSVTFMDLGTGEVLPKYLDERGRRRKERYMRTAPGEASGASRVNDPGPF